METEGEIRKRCDFYTELYKYETLSRPGLESGSQPASRPAAVLPGPTRPCGPPSYLVQHVPAIRYPAKDILQMSNESVQIRDGISSQLLRDHFRRLVPKWKMAMFRYSRHVW